MKTIGVVTVGRSDYGIYLPVIRSLTQDPEFRVQLIVAGMHLSPEFGLTVRDIEADGFIINQRVEMLLSSDTPEGISKSMGLGTIGFAQAYAQQRPDLLMVLGDRFEMHCAVVAAMPFKIPVAHLHGGESTEGVIDECIRHSITKMSHLHFVSAKPYEARVIQMGEEPWRVTVSGAPGLDNVRQIPILDRQTLAERYGLPMQQPLLLVTYHPVTLEYEKTRWQIAELLAALEDAGLPILFTYPNADTYARQIIEMIEEFTLRHPYVQVAKNLGIQGYLSVMSHAAAIVGNSSSGIIEAASFKLPVVNIGNRQKGRIHSRNVINTGYERAEILSAIHQATSPEFRASLQDLVNPYGDGHAAERILAKLRDIPVTDAILFKRFHTLSVVSK